jgi:hypothetical protein
LKIKRRNKKTIKNLKKKKQFLLFWKEDGKEKEKEDGKEKEKEDGNNEIGDLFCQLESTLIQYMDNEQSGDVQNEIMDVLTSQDLWECWFKMK